jgi:hypothetical protein
MFGGKFMCLSPFFPPSFPLLFECCGFWEGFLGGGMGIETLALTI